MANYNCFLWKPLLIASNMHTMKNHLYLLCLLVLSSCTTVKVSVPTPFEKEAVRMPVKGIDGWQVNQRLRFGPFETSPVKRGWDFSSALKHTRLIPRPDELLLKVFAVDIDVSRNSKQGRFQYSIGDGNQYAEIFATEKLRQKQLVYKRNIAWLGEVSKDLEYNYEFAAAILLPGEKNAEPWSLVITNRYDFRKDTARRILDRSYVEEEGYATNGTEHISITPLRIMQAQTASGKETKLMSRMVSGYELKWDDGVVAIIDLLDNSIWMYKDLDAEDKLIISAISSAMMLKRMKDVANEKDDPATW